jgi:endonuclease YncB( thermonuclease family)
MVFADLVSRDEGTGAYNTNFGSYVKPFDTQSTFISEFSNQLSDSATMSFIQTQSESNTLSNPDVPQSNTSDIPEKYEDKFANNSYLTDNDPPGSESTSSPGSITVKCEGSALCLTGEVVKVIDGKTFYVNIQNKVYKVQLALIGLPIQSEQAMKDATTFTRNTCLGSNVLIDQDDGQKVNSFIAQVYCSPTKHLNSMLLQTGYVVLDKAQCQASEFSNLDWATSYGC